MSLRARARALAYFGSYVFGRAARGERALILLHQFGKAKVDQLDVAVSVEQHILRF